MKTGWCLNLLQPIFVTAIDLTGSVVINLKVYVRIL